MVSKPVSTAFTDFGKVVIPELLAASNFDYWIGSAGYISGVQTFVWDRVLESAAAADTVLTLERHRKSARLPTDVNMHLKKRRIISQAVLHRCYDLLMMRP